MNEKGHAVAVFLESPQGIPLVRDPKKPSPLFWKLPGGRGEPSEIAEITAIREIAEELGINLDSCCFERVYTEDRGNHVFTLFKVILSLLPPLKAVGNEGEEIKLFSRDEIDELEDLFPPHRKILRQSKHISGN